VKLLVLNPESTLVEESGLLRVRVPLVDGGSIGIHPGHHPLIAESRAGQVEYGREEYTESISVRDGILRVKGDRIAIYTSGLDEDPGLVPEPEQATDGDQIVEELEERLGEGF
jgi:F0F1-type ATP synthase epsilon subunit